MLYFSPQNDGEVKEEDAGEVFKLLIEISINQIERNFGYYLKIDVKEAKDKNNQKHLAAYAKLLILSLCIESYKPLTLKVNFLCNVFGFDMSFLVANKYFSIFLDSPALCLDPLIKFISYKRKKIIVN